MYTESMGQQVLEEKIVFGLVADKPAYHTLLELLETYQYSYYDIATIAREVLYLSIYLMYLSIYLSI